MAHPLFRASKRYPALLRFLIDRTLAGRADELKERTIGVAVFNRSPDYDTAVDHIVRSTVSEMRRRLADYYALPEHAGELRIDIPPGGYVPLFRAPGHASAGSPHAGANGDRRRSHWLLSSGLATGAVAIIAVVAHWGVPGIRPGAVSQLWDPVLRPAPRITICAGAMYPQDQPDPLPSQAASEPGVTVTFAAGMARITRFLQSRGREAAIIDAGKATVADLSAANFILTGAFNNPWTLRLTDPLRFHFVRDDGARTLCIEDRANPARKDYCVAIGQRADQVTADYGLLARVFDPATRRTAMVLAGHYRYGVSAAGLLARDERYARLLADAAPRGWERKNIEVVISTEVSAGAAGPPRIRAIHVW